MAERAMTLAEQILSHAAGHPVQAGDLVIVEIDRCMSHDSLTPEVIDALQGTLNTERVYDPSRVAVMIDHVAPAASVGAVARLLGDLVAQVRPPAQGGGQARPRALDALPGQLGTEHAGGCRLLRPVERDARAEDATGRPFDVRAQRAGR